jgi:hypothetical protein
MAVKKYDIKKAAKRARKLARKKGLLDKSWPELMKEIRLKKREDQFVATSGRIQDSVDAVETLERIRQ